MDTVQDPQYNWRRVTGGGVLFNLITALILANAFAQTEGFYKVSINGKRCGDLMTVTDPVKTYTELDYAISDLEGLLFTYLEKMQNIDQVPAPRLEYAFRDLLNLKAEILNDVISTLPYIAASTMDESRKNKLLNSIYQIIDTMGIPAKVFGFEVAEDGGLSFPGKRRPKNKMKVVSIARARDAIGFLGGKPPARDLPEGEHRSIGFGHHSISIEEAPARVGGSIQRSISDVGEDKQLLVIDGETGTIYHLPIMRVAFQGAKAGGKQFQLDFNNEINEWVVVVTNLNNPEGKIGFMAF